ncbi:MAG: hypothetical protein IKX26_03540 [Bacteroidales bacterium]|nr:hypothetical protein [Bacteroidales bacterium]
MKSRILTLALLAMMLLPAAADAQNTKEKQLATIREEYAGAMKMLEMRSDPEYPAKDKIVITSDEMWPGSGQHNGKMEIFFGLDLSEEESEIQRFPRFARYSYNIGSQKYYYEILWYDPDDGNPEHCQPIFFHSKNTDYHDKTVECRHYFWDGKLLKTLINNTQQADEDYIPSPEEALSRAKMIFQIATMNNLWNY